MLAVVALIQACKELAYCPFGLYLFKTEVAR